MPSCCHFQIIDHHTANSRLQRIDFPTTSVDLEPVANIWTFAFQSHRRTSTVNDRSISLACWCARHANSPLHSEHSRMTATGPLPQPPNQWLAAATRKRRGRSFYFSHFGAHTFCALPSNLRVMSCVRGRCFPHRKHDMVAVWAYWLVSPNGDPDALAL